MLLLLILVRFSYSFISPYKFQDFFFYISEECHWGFDKVALILYISFSDIAIFSTLFIQFLNTERLFMTQCLLSVYFLSTMPMFTYHKGQNINSSFEKSNVKKWSLESEKEMGMLKENARIKDTSVEFRKIYSFIKHKRLIIVHKMHQLKITMKII